VACCHGPYFLKKAWPIQVGKLLTDQDEVYGCAGRYRQTFLAGGRSFHVGKLANTLTKKLPCLFVLFYNQDNLAFHHKPAEF
jgi:hypothetical protein